MIENFAGMMGKGFTRLRQSYAPATPFQQPNLPRCLHLPQSITGRSKRESDVRRAVGDAASVSDGEEKP